jgi:hypothetical protein
LFQASHLGCLVVLAQAILPLVVAGGEVVMCPLQQLVPLRKLEELWQEQANLQEVE